MNDVATAMTDSLSRSGKGGMSVALKVTDGVAGAPGLSFNGEPTSGLYRGPNGVGLSALGVSVATFLNTIITFLKPLYVIVAADGVKAAFRAHSVQTVNIMEIQNSAGTMINGFDATGALIVAPAPPLPGSQTLVSNIGTSTWTKPTAANFIGIKVHLTGPGGGGGGTAVTAASQGAGGSGGGAGATMEAWIPAAQIASGVHNFAMGAPGIGVAGADGTDGGTSTFSTGTSAMTVEGGKKGLVGAAVASVGGADGGLGASVYGNGTGVQRTAHNGGDGGGSFVGVVSGVARALSGIGGCSFYGGGFKSGQGTPTASTCPGAGGTAAAVGASAAVRAGGNGGPGLIVIEEIYS